MTERSTTETEKEHETEKEQSERGGRVQRWQGALQSCVHQPVSGVSRRRVRGGGPNRSWPSGLLAVTSHSQLGKLGCL